MGSKIIQPSFAGGELDPGLYGRVDLARYGICVRTGRNFIVKPAGGVVSRRGFQFIGEVDDSSKRVRLLPFEVSADVAYVAVLEQGKCQFLYRGAYVMDGPDRVEITTPYQEADLPMVHITQSADTMFLAHPKYPPRRIARVSATEFVTDELVFREGPFRTINSDEARQMWASGATGTITLSTNFDLFSPDMVGALVYLEQKALGTIKPWVQGERTTNLALGVQRRSDGKVYVCTTIPAGGTDWAETGNVRPTHEIGREWDAPGDVRTAGGFTWTVGVEWEYLHSGYGIAQITGYTNARSVTALVKRTMPGGVVGGLGGPLNTWTASGDGSTKAFAIAGATQVSQSNYTVTVGGVPEESDPNYPGGGGGTGPRCVHVDSRLPGGVRAGEVKVGDVLMLVDPCTGVERTGRVTFSRTVEAELWRVLAANGVSLVCSATAPIAIERNGHQVPAELMGERILTRRGGVVAWSEVTDVQRIGRGPVQHLTVENADFWAGETADGYMAHHNSKPYDPYGD